MSDGKLHPDWKFDREAKDRFLEHFRQFGLVGLAAEAAGVSRETVNRHCRELLEGEPNPCYDPVFVAEREEALEHHKEITVKEAWERAVDGWVERPVFGKDGEHLGDVRKKSDRLMELFLKRNDASFREKVSVDQRTEHAGSATLVHEGTVSLKSAIGEMSDEELDALDLILERREERDGQVDVEVAGTGDNGDR